MKTKIIKIKNAISKFVYRVKVNQKINKIDHDYHALILNYLNHLSLNGNTHDEKSKIYSHRITVYNKCLKKLYEKLK